MISPGKRASEHTVQVSMEGMGNSSTRLVDMCFSERMFEGKGAFLGF